MQDIDLIQVGLGLPEPWEVKACDLDIDNGFFDIQIDFSSGSLFPCPKCGRKDCKAYDTKQMSWRHLNFFEYPAFLNARTPRVDCPDCGVHQVDVPWGRRDCGFTHLLEGYILKLAKSTPVEGIAKLLDEHDTRLWRTILHYSDKIYENIDFKKVKRIGIDEITSTEKGHHYITTFVDMDASTPIFVAEGKDASTIKQFVEEMVKRGGDPATIEDVSCDMSPAYISGVESYLPNARITFDKFHIVKSLNKAVDDVRRQEQKTCTDLEATRWIWLKNPEELTHNELEIKMKIEMENPGLKTVEAYNLRIEFQKLWDQPTHKAQKFLKKWYDRALNSGMEPIRQFASTLEQHWEGVINWFKSHINNGILEGINSLINVAKFRARGFRTIRHLAAIVFLISGAVDPVATHTM
jgi:transposase